uniref:Uncharacterized protein n=1 Tax=Anguilla anguilla TaxID=7936 RepID=A0A0E9RJR9_ANGAN
MTTRGKTEILSVTCILPPQTDITVAQKKENLQTFIVSRLNK